MSSRKHKEEAKEKMRLAWVKRRETFIPPMKGKKMSDEARQKMSDAARKHQSNHLGKKHTPETLKKISETTRQRTPRGPACHSYKDGKHAERMGLRHSLEYKRWRFDVYARDNFTCQHCGDKRGGNLVAHHIKPFADYPELRLDVKNGITLCQSCHHKLHYEATVPNDSIMETESTWE